MDSSEYLKRKQSVFTPPNAELRTIRAAIPSRLFAKSTSKGLYYVFRTLLFAMVFFKLSSEICNVSFGGSYWTTVIRSVLWASYWWCQGIVFAGFWCLAHEAGHGNISSRKAVNNVVGYVLHTFLLTPYFAWRSTHYAHHKMSGHMTFDENYVPYTRSSYGLPVESRASVKDYREAFEESPLYALGRTLIMQSVGLMMYFGFNLMGSPAYPRGTNHFNPSSPLFKQKEYRLIVVSDIGLLTMTAILVYLGVRFGFMFLVRHYLMQYLLTNNWIVLITYLHHSDPTIPHYRSSQWSFIRGALATVDRPVMGWIGRFFFMNVSHDHVGHHLFYTIPFYNQPKVTQILREILAEDYMYDSTNCFYAFYRSLDKCRFVEDVGDIVMYKDALGRQGRPLRVDAGKKDKASS